MYRSIDNRPKPAPAPPPDGSAIRRMQNRWEAETQQREAAAAKSQLHKPPVSTRGRDRWGSSNDAQTSSVDANRTTSTSSHQLQGIQLC